MSREASFNFIPQNLLGNNKDSGQMVSFNLQTQMITFSMKCHDTKNLIGKWVKFYVDSGKNTLAWKLIDEKDFADLKGYNQIKQVNYNDTLQVKVYVPKVCVDSLKLKKGVRYIKIPVKQYKTQDRLMPEEFNYISFNGYEKDEESLSTPPKE